MIEFGILDDMRRAGQTMGRASPSAPVAFHSSQAVSRKWTNFRRAFEWPAPARNLQVRTYRRSLWQICRLIRPASSSEVMSIGLNDQASPVRVARIVFVDFDRNAQARSWTLEHWNSLRHDAKALDGRFPTNGWDRQDKTNSRFWRIPLKKSAFQ